MKDIILTVKEQTRVRIVTFVLDRTLTAAEAAAQLGLSVRHVRRLAAALQRDGPAALAHGNRGKPSSRRTPDAVREQVVTLYQKEYAGWNHQHFSEQLPAHDLDIPVRSVRRFLTEAGLRSPRTQRRRQRHRSVRPRRPAEGMLLQVDGSPYPWLGVDGPRLSLIGAIDDATGDPVAAVFREQEDGHGYLLMLRQILDTRGVPLAIYHDRHGIFQVNLRRPPTLEEDLTGQRAPTQVGRVLAELGIQAIPANSPQAKGRIENLWRTFQDRLTKELQAARVTTIEQANAFLPGFLERYRARFAVAPLSPEPAWVPLDPAVDLDRILCFKHTRVVTHANTISFEGCHYQIPPGPDRLGYARAKVEVLRHLNGSLSIYHHGRCLVRNPQPVQKPAPLPKEVSPLLSPGPRKPAPDHPWRKPFTDRTDSLAV